MRTHRLAFSAGVGLMGPDDMNLLSREKRGSEFVNNKPAAPVLLSTQGRRLTASLRRRVKRQQTALHIDIFTSMGNVGTNLVFTLQQEASPACR